MVEATTVAPSTVDDSRSRPRSPGVSARPEDCESARVTLRLAPLVRSPSMPRKYSLRVTVCGPPRAPWEVVTVAYPCQSLHVGWSMGTVVGSSWCHSTLVDEPAGGQSPKKSPDGQPPTRALSCIPLTGDPAYQPPSAGRA